MSNFRFTRPEAFPPIIKNLIIINVIVWLAQMMYDSQYQLTNKLGLWTIQVPEFKPYQFVTHMFAHSPGMPFHILFNMLMLWMFGRVLENVWGHKRFLFFYLACGLGAAICHELVQYIQYERVLPEIYSAFQEGDTLRAQELVNKFGPAIGASGAVMGVMVGFAFLFPNTELFIMFIPIPVKAKWAVLGYFAIDLFAGVNPSNTDNIAHFAHIGGAITGFIIVWIWNKTNKRTLY